MMTMRKSVSGIFLIALISLLCSCATSLYQNSARIPAEIFNKPAPPEAEELWQMAETALNSGDLARAINTWQQIADTFPTNAIAPRALSQIGKLNLDKGHPDTALHYFDSIIKYFPQWSGVLRTRVDRVEALWAQGKHDKAIKEAQKLWKLPIADPDSQVRLCAVFAKAYADQTSWPAAFRWLATGFAKAQTKNQKSALSTTAINIASRLDENTARQLLDGSLDMIRPFLEFRLASLKLATGAQDAGRKQMLELMARYPNHPIVDEIRHLFGQDGLYANLPVRPERIGCLIPLNGSYANYGQEVLRALALAVENWNREKSYDPVTLIVKDTSAQPHQAVQCLESLVKDYGVAAVVGPLSAKCTDAIAPDTIKFGVPVISLTQKESVTAESPFVFHVLVNNQDLVTSLVRYCRQQLGLERFAVLYPEDRYGKRLTDIFTDVVENLGGHLVASVSYPQGTTDFKKQINELKTQERTNPYSSDMGASSIEALFIPDQAQTVALIAPQLPYYNMIGVTLLGPNLWDDPALIQIGGTYVENALFATAFPISNGPTDAQTFRESFQSIYGEAPGYLEAQAYDALNIVLEARSHQPAKNFSRISLRNSLFNIPQYDGLTGTSFFLPNGNMEHNYLIYQILNGEAVQVNP